MNFRTLALAAVATVAMAASAQARDQIRIVGSSTVYPFSTAVAEQFGKTSGFKTPVVESTGSGGGLKLFCAGNGPDTPDITNASRRIIQSRKWPIAPPTALRASPRSLSAMTASSWPTPSRRAPVRPDPRPDLQGHRQDRSGRRQAGAESL